MAVSGALQGMGARGLTVPSRALGPGASRRQSGGGYLWTWGPWEKILIRSPKVALIRSAMGVWIEVDRASVLEVHGVHGPSAPATFKSMRNDTSAWQGMVRPGKLWM